MEFIGLNWVRVCLYGCIYLNGEHLFCAFLNLPGFCGKLISNEKSGHMFTEAKLLDRRVLVYDCLWTLNTGRDVTLALMLPSQQWLEGTV